jgi:hypothetical protein
MLCLSCNLWPTQQLRFLSYEVEGRHKITPPQSEITSLC